MKKITDLQFRALTRDANAAGAVDGRPSLLGTPAAIADALRIRNMHGAAGLTFSSLRR